MECLKVIEWRREFLDAAAGEVHLAETADFTFASIDKLGSITQEQSAIEAQSRLCWLIL